MSEAKRKSEFGIWRKNVKMKDGTTSEVLSFSVNGVRYSAWPNKYKSSAKSPDFNVYIDTYVKPESTEQPAVANNTTAKVEDLPF